MIEYGCVHVHVNNVQVNKNTNFTCRIARYSEKKKNYLFSPLSCHMLELSQTTKISNYMNNNNSNNCRPKIKGIDIIT